ncbi:MAG: nucleotidyl transferase AbiEii/AbiGii toxin family protein [Candidatus Wallbacteria bacterium]|nr:nucleotidyl transferase AbiEii/AbiGii toxin family protein [Candidatus Wallbacteria bacterium]
MHEAVRQMLSVYQCDSVDQYLRAAREIMQEIALLGLWRARFFERAAFYGGTSLRILHGLDRFSEDLDFSLLEPDTGFDVTSYLGFLKQEMESFGFNVEISAKEKNLPVQSAFLKAGTRELLLNISTDENIADSIHSGSIVRLKLEVDTDPPSGFSTETRYLLKPVPFAVRMYSLPDLFAGKMHAVLWRKWKNRVKGRDWYDLVWYAANHPVLNLKHLERRMRQSGHWKGKKELGEKEFRKLLAARIREVDFKKAASEVEPFVKDPESLKLWSREFFLDVSERLKITD